MQAVKDGQRQGGALTIKHTAARKGKGKGPAGKAGPPGSDLERKVVNCLSCGKVFDFRLAGAGQLTNDLLRFLGQPAFDKSAVLYCHSNEQRNVCTVKPKWSRNAFHIILLLHLRQHDMQGKPSASLEMLSPYLRVQQIYITLI